MHVVQINKILFDIKCSKTQLEKSLFFEKSFVQNKIDCLHLLERAFDEHSG